MVRFEFFLDCLKQRNDNKGMELVDFEPFFNWWISITLLMELNNGRGVPILAWPNRGDQFHDAKLVTNYLKMGHMILLSDDPREMVKKEDIVQEIDELMNDEEEKNIHVHSKTSYEACNVMGMDVENLCGDVKMFTGGIAAPNSPQCPIVFMRCEKGIGEDWHKIAHIPYLNMYYMFLEVIFLQHYVYYTLLVNVKSIHSTCLL
ncbi:hypothetical protein MTR67_036634 [Solanum verrucosum]|uniref:Uncharacterized protein n=1 Tax=Solanum verrucosum TaxID=315347 RepID=A0AAF0ZNH3_SOLVR|nr:hypothetical protein MTR67_036634 [Solanum verrucosum]